jgi:hypothetical protein
MPRVLKDLTITEVSSVDRGAGEGVKVLLMKRAINTPTPEEAEMTEQELNDKIAKAVAAALAPVVAASAGELAKRDAEIAVLKMSPAHKAFMDDNCKDEASKKAFTEMDDAQRDQHMNSFKKSADAATSGDLAKRDQVIKAQEDTIVALTKRLDAYDLEKAQAVFTKRAADLGLNEPGDGEIMRKAYAGDPTAQAQFEARQATVVAALRKQAETGALFNEFGTSKGVVSKAYDALEAKAAELRKTDKSLTKEQAFAKVYEDPENAVLVAQNKADEARARLSVVA